MESIGEILKQQREQRGLALEQVHDASKITVHNLSALEEDRFDYFPNRVYARAFLRDYANYLGLDSTALLTRYEEEWNATPKEPEVVAKPSGSIWRGIGYSFLALVIIAGLGAAAYFGWSTRNGKTNIPSVKRQASAPPKENVATLPKPGVVAPKKPEATPIPQPKPAQPAQPAQPVALDKVALTVTPLRDVWLRIETDGQQAFMGILPAGQIKTWEAKSRVKIRAGMAGAVQLKLNGRPVPALGTMKEAKTKEFTLTEVKAQAKPITATPQVKPPSENAP